MYIRSALAIITANFCCGPMPALSQTESQCLQSFSVQSGKNVSYITVNGTGLLKAPITVMSCSDAEGLRERLYVSMDKSVYDSEAVLRSKLATSKNLLNKLDQDLNAAADAISVKAKIAGVTAIITSTWAISTTATCISAVVDGAGIAACGPAVRAAASAVASWSALAGFSGDVAALKASARIEIKKQQTEIDSVTQQLNSSVAKNIKDNYSQLFVGICRAVREQCL